MQPEALGLNLFLVTRTDPGAGWDTYSEFIVSCDNEQEAREIHPNGGMILNRVLGGWSNKSDDTQLISNHMRRNGKRYNNGWVNAEDVTTMLNVEWIGKAKASFEKGEVLMSVYHAG
jgi:hypothetical protein